MVRDISDMERDPQYKEYVKAIRDLESLETSLYQIIGRIQKTISDAETLEESPQKLRERVLILEKTVVQAFEDFKKKK